jgi:hypothetical protein
MARMQIVLWLSLAGILVLGSARAASPSATDFSPDPKSVQRYGPAYRYPQAGWIVLHIEGKPYDRGYQHGRLMASEILGYLRCFAAMQSPRAPGEGWKNTRSLVNALFLRRYKQEYLEEMKGIADGAAAAGARFEDRPIDLVDIVGLNVWPEIETLDSALEATATGLEGIRFPNQQPRVMPDPKPMHCSAFAATGPATADAKIVFGHITMFGLYPSLFYNVWIDVKPDQGHRVLMQSYPAGIQSGFDYYMNDVGILVCETTIAQTHFDIRGLSVASRIREALQYADSIDQAVEILKKENNGLYTNEWLLADTKTNEIAMFELGTARSKLYRSSKNEWFGGTEGFYWGCNNTKDLEVRLETIPGVKGRPANVVWRPTDRDKTWQELYTKYKGKIDADFGKLAFTTPPLAAYHSLDAKFTTTDLAKDLKTWALFGPPLGRTWQPTQEERQRFPEVRPMVSNPWTILHANAPPKREPHLIAAVDLPDRIESKVETVARQEQEKPVPTNPAWHGTLMPKTAADTWLASAFANYERIVALEEALGKRNSDGKLSQADKDRLAVELFHYQSEYLAAARASQDASLSQTRADIARDEWYRMAEGKGVLVLHQLRRLLGNEVFLEAMASFGKENAGKEVSTAQFREHVEKASGKKLIEFFDYWLIEEGLPILKLSDDLKRSGFYTGEHRASVSPNGNGYTVETHIQLPAQALPARVEVTVETAKGKKTESRLVKSTKNKFALHPEDKPQRVLVDTDVITAQKGGAYGLLSFLQEPKQTLIVYGTRDEIPTNKEAAEALQQAIRQSWCNVTVPIKTDKEVTDTDFSKHHLLLIGRPDTNWVVRSLQSELPIHFGLRSFTVGQDHYAHAGSAVIAAGDNVLTGSDSGAVEFNGGSDVISASANRRYSAVVIAGLSAESTLQAAPLLLSHGKQAGNVLVLPHGGPMRGLVVPTRELVVDLFSPEPEKAKAATGRR